ncbi:glycosyltransferase family 4 protein [Halegenticoccus soli]|uniref:glycosyltransferase family 4 protein n=1 Tax=Halegenticoccus soli TaxID=1985678 RepID=UPI000C6D2411|nr:glycosyltransferase family 4 protein [Halegenticoccus soli]
MRVCVLSDGYPPWEHGGAQKIAAQLADGYARRGHEVSVVTTVTDRKERGRIRRGGIDVHRIYAPRYPALLPYLTVYNPFTARACERALALIAPDVVHAHNVHWLSNRSLRAAAERGVPVVKTFHDAGTVSYGELTCFVESDPPTGKERIPASAYRVTPRRQLRRQGLRYFPLRNRLNRRHLDRHVDVGVAVSDELRRALRANGVPCHRTVRNGVPAPEPDPSREADAAAFREEHDLGDAPIVLFAGRTGYNKGGRHLADAFGRLARRADRSVRLVVAGDDEYVPEMRRAAGRAGGDIVSTGWLPRARLDAAFEAATVVASPSVHLDPFPTVNLEAFARGTPVVTTWFGGAKELVDHGENGFVVNPLDVESLTEALSTLVARPALAERFGERGRRKVTARYTVDRQVDRYLDLLESVVRGT